MSSLLKLETDENETAVVMIIGGFGGSADLVTAIRG